MSRPPKAGPADPSLQALIDVAIRDLHALSDDIMRAVDCLPRLTTPKATREMFEQQGRRAKAIAAALAVEARDPDEELARPLLGLTRKVAAGALAVASIVAVGALEQSGADAIHALTARASTMAQGLPDPAEPPPTPPADEDPPRETEFGPALRQVLGEARTTPRELSISTHMPVGRINSYLRGHERPNLAAWNHLARALLQDHHVPTADVQWLRTLRADSPLPEDSTGDRRGP